MSILTRRSFVQSIGASVSASSLLNGAAGEKHLLYVANPGVRNYVEHGGIGVTIFDIADGYRFVRRLPTWEATG